MDILKGIRPIDHVVAAALVALAALIGVANATAGADADVAHSLDSHSWTMVPVFGLIAAAVLWRRRHVLAVIVVATLAMAATLPIYGWVTRCGWALPMAALLAYAVARYAGSRQNHLLGLFGIALFQVVTLVRDASTGGLGGLVVGIPAALVAYGIGLLVRNAVARRVERPTLSVEHARA